MVNSHWYASVWLAIRLRCLPSMRRAEEGGLSRPQPRLARWREAPALTGCRGAAPSHGNSDGNAEERANTSFQRLGRSRAAIRARQARAAATSKALRPTTFRQGDIGVSTRKLGLWSRPSMDISTTARSHARLRACTLTHNSLRELPLRWSDPRRMQLHDAGVLPVACDQRAKGGTQHARPSGHGF